MPVTDAVLNAAADGATTLLAYASIHTDDPSTTGANEVTGGGYARQEITWNPATGAVATADGTLSFSGPANEDATHLGFWSAAESGTFRGAVALTGDQTFNSEGEYNVTSVTVTASNDT
ncbi:MAG TPA: hypothetical protein VKZ89_08680 [Thermobifida alba]|nr:hypothetical protein [Thermobifida alba]